MIPIDTSHWTSVLMSKKCFDGSKYLSRDTSRYSSNSHVLGSLNDSSQGTGLFQEVDRRISMFAQPADLRNEVLRLGSWRRKIIKAKVFRNPVLGRRHQRPWVPLHHLAPPPFNEIIQDGLMLTATTLRSLFDNSLQRIQNCTCSLGSVGGNIIQSKVQRNNWSLWYTLAPNKKVCDGTQCIQNQFISFADGEKGKRFYTNTPFILGWSAEIRSTASMKISAKHSHSQKSEQARMITYNVESLQGQAQLSVAAPIIPQTAGAVTLRGRCLKFPIRLKMNHK